MGALSMVEYIPVVLKNHIRCQAASFTTLYSWSYGKNIHAA